MFSFDASKLESDIEQITAPPSKKPLTDNSGMHDGQSLNWRDYGDPNRLYVEEFLSRSSERLRNLLH